MRFVVYKSDAKEHESPTWSRVWTGLMLEGLVKNQGAAPERAHHTKAPKPQGGRTELWSWLGSGQGGAAQGPFLTVPWWPLAGLKGPNPSSWDRTSIQDQLLLSVRDLTKPIHFFTQLKDQQRRNSPEKFPSGHIQRPWWKPWLRPLAKEQRHGRALHTLQDGGQCWDHARVCGMLGIEGTLRSGLPQAFPSPWDRCAAGQEWDLRWKPSVSSCIPAPHACLPPAVMGFSSALTCHGGEKPFRANFEEQTVKN